MASIRSFKQVEAICKQVLGKCHVMNMGHESHASGFLEVHIIVGQRVNPSFHPDAKIGDKSERFEADVRIMYIRPGSDELDLIKKLKAIKESAARVREETNALRAVSPEEQKKHIDKQELSKLAAAVEAGDEIPSDDSEDFSERIDEFDDKPLSKKELAEKAKELEDVDKPDLDLINNIEDTTDEHGEDEPELFEIKVLNALQALNKNVSEVIKDVDNLKKQAKVHTKASTKKIN